MKSSVTTPTACRYAVAHLSGDAITICSVRSSAALLGMTSQRLAPREIAAIAPGNTERHGGTPPASMKGTSLRIRYDTPLCMP